MVHGISFMCYVFSDDIFYYSFDFKVLEFQIWFMFIVSRNAKGKENVFDDRVIIGHRYKVRYKALSVLYMRI